MSIQEIDEQTNTFTDKLAKEHKLTHILVVLYDPDTGGFYSYTKGVESPLYLVGVIEAVKADLLMENQLNDIT